MSSVHSFFDQLRRSVELIARNFDNEAQRRGLLIRPVLTSAHGLGYAPQEVLSEVPY